MGRCIQVSARLVLGFGVGAACLHAQVAPPVLRFDVASVRPNRTSECRGRWDLAASHGTVTADNAPLRRIISRAYNLTDDRVSGPSWLDSQCYDIQAKGAAEVPERDLMRMLQELLKERFHLAAHVDPEERPIFALLVDKGGSKLRPYGDKVSVPSSAGSILFMARHVPDLCERLGMVTGRPVINKTGLDGDYQIELSYVRFGSTSNDPSDTTLDIFSAVRTQLGLRLEPQRAPVDI